jgi:hypothetical protein
MGERWGKPFEDDRNWPEYNAELVARGEFLLDFDWVKSWDSELDDMNEGKVGAKFQFPETLIELQAVWAQLLDYRGLEGCARQLANQGILPAFNDYTTIWRRVQEVNAKIILPPDAVVEVSSDGSGLKMNCRGEYRATKYDDRKRKKFIRVVITADPRNKKLLAVTATIEGEESSETKLSMGQMSSIMSEGMTISKAYGDGAFDTRPFFNFLQEYGIDSAVKIRRNASTKARGSLRRAREVKEFKEDGYKKWAKDRKYGLRWPGTEGIFSAVKRKFGEKIRSKKKGNMCLEAERRFWAYDCMAQYAKRG